MTQLPAAVFVLGLAALPLHAQTPADDPIAIVSRLTEVICVPMATEGSRSSAEASAEARVGLSKFLKGLADAGLSLAGKVDAEKYVNVLQDDLSGQLSDQRACNLRVLSDFSPQIGEWIAAAESPTGAAATGGVSITNSGSKNANIVGSGNNVTIGN